MILAILFIILGFFLLIKGADWVVDAAVSISKRFNISEWVVGMTLVAMGGSLPELMVNLYAASHNQPQIALSNILGSVAANLCLVLGITAFMRPILINKFTLKTEIPLSIFSVLLLGFLVFIFNRSTPNEAMSLYRYDGVVLLMVFVGVMAWTFFRYRDISHHNQESVKANSSHNYIVKVILGFVGLFVGSKWVVDGALVIADLFGMNEGVVGFTIVAIGTSLPEIAASSQAALKGKSEIAIANVIGSNIFNILFILGLSALISPIRFFGTDIRNWIFCFSATLLVGFCFACKKSHKLMRSDGIILLTVYAVYLTQMVYENYS